MSRSRSATSRPGGGSGGRRVTASPRRRGTKGVSRWRASTAGLHARIGPGVLLAAILLGGSGLVADEPPAPTGGARSHPAGGEPGSGPPRLPGRAGSTRRSTCSSASDALDEYRGLPYSPAQEGTRPTLAPRPSRSMEAQQQLQLDALDPAGLPPASWESVGPAPIPNGQTTTRSDPVSGRPPRSPFIPRTPTWSTWAPRRAACTAPSTAAPPGRPSSTPRSPWPSAPRHRTLESRHRLRGHRRAQPVRRQLLRRGPLSHRQRRRPPPTSRAPSTRAVTTGIAGTDGLHRPGHQQDPRPSHGPRHRLRGHVHGHRRPRGHGARRPGRRPAPGRARGSIARRTPPPARRASQKLRW